MKNIIEKFKSLFGKSEVDSQLEDRIQATKMPMEAPVINVEREVKESEDRIARWSDDLENTTTIKVKPDPRQTKLKKYKNVKRPNEFEKGKPRFYGEK